VRLPTFLRVATLAAAALLLSGCSFTGINSLPLPFGKGGGNDDLRVTVQLANAANLVPNSEVRYQDVVVGSVRNIEFDRWHAKLTLGIERSAHIPGDVGAKVAQKSLLGAEYVQLSAPSAAPTGGLLHTGAVIGLGRTGRYPETEEVLSAAALLLDNGGLGQVHTISHELNQALTGRTGDVRSLVHQVSLFTERLDMQRDQITGALKGLDRLSRAVNAQRPTLDRALRHLPRGIRTLASERTDLVAALNSLNDFSTVAHRVISETRGGLVQNLDNLRPVTKQLADHAASLAKTINMLTFPFPVKAVDKSFYGDYINFFAKLNLNLTQTAQYWTGGTPMGTVLSALLGVPPTAAGTSDVMSELKGILRSGPTTSKGLPRQPLPQGLSGLGGASRHGSKAKGGQPSSGLTMDGLVGGVMGGRS
jgi:phospholipid/cholesterol/gamma-HCH transport system substrate-binding protein